MKILYSGNKPWWIGKEAFCDHCAAAMVIEKEDVMVQSMEIDMVKGKCPSCGMTFNVYKTSRDHQEFNMALKINQ